MATLAPPRVLRPHGRGGLTLACRLLPADLRGDVTLLYGVFRRLDDAVDDGDPDAERRVAALEDWCDDGRARSPETEALARLAERRPVPAAPLRSFARGMRHDLEGETIETEADLDRYCLRVAGSVALLVTAWLGTSRPSEDAAGTLGIALQRTNILRDIDEDRAAGRTYLPRETLERHGPPLPGRREALLREQIARADALYDRGQAGIAGLLRGRRAIAAAAATYRGILRQIEREGYGRRPGRAVVPDARRAMIAALACARTR